MRSFIILPTAAVVAILGAAAVNAQEKSTSDESNGPTPGSLVVGALGVGAHANLVVAGYDIGVARDKIVYSYFLKNAGAAELTLAAAVALPELRASADETWTLAANDPENPVGLTISAGGAPAAAKTEVHAYALGLDRLAEIKAARLPLIPFGAETDEALAALPPDAVDRLAALGVVSPRDPAAPKSPLTADWSLEAVQNFRLVLPPGKTTAVSVKFTPIAAAYRLAKGDEQDIEDMKDDLCLTPQTLGALEGRLKRGGAWAATDITLAVDAPTRWLDAPSATLSVQKPKADAVVAFCGVDEKTAGQPTVLGAAPDDVEDNQLRIVIFEPAVK